MNPFNIEIGYTFNTVLNIEKQSTSKFTNYIGGENCGKGFAKIFLATLGDENSHVLYLPCKYILPRSKQY